MRAARYYGPGDVRIDEIPEPEPGDGQVAIRVEWCGICGTDLHEYYDGPVFCPTATEPHPLTGATSPVVLGHEFVGVVEAIGAGVSRARLGERVVVEPRQTCNECDACRSGHHNCCPSAATIGLQGGGGGLAELIAVDEGLVYPIGDIPADVGAVIEPLAVALHAVRQAGTVEGASAAVFGAGPIGLLVTWMLKVHGAGSVVLVEPSVTRRGRGPAFGADRGVDPKAEDVVAAIREATGGKGVDVAFECAGKDAALAGCLESVRPNGTVVNVAISGRPMSVDLLPLILKEIRLVGSICYANDHQAVIDVLAEHPFPVAEFVTGRIPLADLVEQGIRPLAEDNESHVKILVAP
jgi:(R,R)-butanediol dehydrogenase / meso-butanediol dehydrogenase / diacetyl reductase